MYKHIWKISNVMTRECTRFACSLIVSVNQENGMSREILLPRARMRSKGLSDRVGRGYIYIFKKQSEWYFMA